MVEAGELGVSACLLASIECAAARSSSCFSMENMAFSTFSPNELLQTQNTSTSPYPIPLKQQLMSVSIAP